MTPVAKRPAFQFYPDKWQTDKDLRTCSIGARGLWAEIMCVIHTCTPYGHLTDAKGRAMPDSDAAQLCGVGLPSYRKLLAELEDKGVPSRTDGGVLYSRRMVRDEDLRNARAEGGPLGAEHGIKGKEFGKLGGRPRKSKGTNKPPSKPPPVFAVAFASASPPAGSTPTPKTVAPGVAARPAAARTSDAWAAYAEAYEERYGALPVRNAKVSGMFSRLLDRIPIEEAPHVARWFVRSNRGLYVSAKHAVDLLLRDAEALRTEWITKTHGTETQARQADKTQALGNAFGKLIQEAEADGD